MEWQEALNLHRTAIDDFAQTALKVTPEDWANSGDNKWGPAHVTEHLSLVYKVLLAELAGGNGMKVRTNFVVRQMLRWIYLPKLLRGEPFPPARAPREARPVLPALADQNSGIQLLKQLSEEFHQSITRSYELNPKTQLTHVYFGKAPLNRYLLFCVRHIQHHTKGLKV